jgi:hypothetical protein
VVIYYQWLLPFVASSSVVSILREHVTLDNQGKLILTKRLSSVIKSTPATVAKSTRTMVLLGILVSIDMQTWIKDGRWQFSSNLRKNKEAFRKFANDVVIAQEMECYLGLSSRLISNHINHIISNGH